MRRRALGLLLVAATALTAVLLGGAAPAQALGPEVVAWWNAANLGDPAPAPPPPPDVADDDLLVQGSDAGPAGPLGPAPSAQAVAGLAFSLPPGSQVGALTLRVDGSPPPQVAVKACKATSSFTAVRNGPWSQVPTYDPGACVVGALKGDAVTFPDVGTLLDGDALAVVLLPGAADRVVLAAPGEGALAVSGGEGTLTAPAFGSGPGPSPAAAAPPATAPPAAGSDQGVASGPQVADAGVPLAPDSSPGVAPLEAAAPALPDPEVAGAVPTTGPVPLAAGPDRATTPAALRDGGLGTGGRRAAALALIALQVLGFGLLVARRPAPAVGAEPGPQAALAGGRLRAPARDRGRASAAPAVAGVGRFRAERHGRAPSL